MTRLIFVALLFRIFLFGFLYSQDTVEIRTKEIKVEGEKILSYTPTKFFSSSTASLIESVQFGFNKVITNLYTIPGVYIRDYGGLGGVKTISVRGLGATNTTILIDGIKINTTQNGLFDLSLIPSGFVNKIELLRGGFASFYGGNAASGVLNLSLANEEKGNIRTAFETGSFNSYGWDISSNFHVFNQISHFLGLSYLSSKGDYPFTTYQFGEKRNYERENGSFSNFSTIFSNTIEFDNSLLKANFLFSSARRGVPGAVLQNQIESKRAKLDDKFFVGSIGLHSQIFDSTLFSINIDAQILNNKFFDPDGIGVITKKETVKFLNNEFHSSMNFLHTTAGFELNFIAELTFASLKGDMLQPEVGNFVRRISQAIGFTITKSFAIAKNPIEVFASYRFDSYSDFSPYHSFSFGGHAQFFDNFLGTKSTFSSNFRAPSFNEMYYLNYGTNKLKPERSTTFNFEIYSNFYEYFRLTLALFYTITIDKIISIPRNPLQWSAQNLGQSLSRGLEASLLGKISFFTYSLSYTFQDVIDAQKHSLTQRKHIPYTPKSLLSCNARFNIFKYTSLEFRWFYSSERFALPDNSINSRLKPYALLDVALNRELKLGIVKFFITFEFSNILNTDYEIYKNYPMAGRSFRIEIASVIE